MMVLIEILHVVDYILEQVVVRETCAGSRFPLLLRPVVCFVPDKCCYGQSWYSNFRLHGMISPL